MLINSTVEPNAPVNVTVDSKSSRVVNISWIPDFDGNSAIQNYTVKRSRDNAEFLDAVCQGSLSKTNSCVVSSTSASFANLLPWTTYYFKVFARNVVGTSGGSSVASTTTDQEGTVHAYKQCSCFKILTFELLNTNCCLHPKLLRLRLLDIWLCCIIKCDSFFR